MTVAETATAAPTGPAVHGSAFQRPGRSRRSGEERDRNADPDHGHDRELPAADQRPGSRDRESERRDGGEAQPGGHVRPAAQRQADDAETAEQRTEEQRPRAG